MLHFITNIFTSRKLPTRINHTLITLIPKIEHVDTIQNFRPIGFYNTIYKIITKIIVNRIKHMVNIICPYHAAFLPQRRTTDNIVITQEILHFSQSYKGKKNFMIIKLDMEKAFDRIEWSFIKNVIQFFNFLTLLSDLILQCITTISLELLINGRRTSAFYPTKGIPQGDPISPYIFIICMKYLYCLIQHAVHKNNGNQFTFPSKVHPFFTFCSQMILFSLLKLPLKLFKP